MALATRFLRVCFSSSAFAGYGTANVTNVMNPGQQLFYRLNLRRNLEGMTPKFLCQIAVGIPDSGTKQLLLSLVQLRP
ncbi:MAG TPA: hypothetical protein VFF11_13975 [Candidatus Binatia bacterium]|nr:hypothetical protein [Candidatus Binatia bacterium]